MIDRVLEVAANPETEAPLYCFASKSLSLSSSPAPPLLLSSPLLSSPPLPSFPFPFRPHLFCATPARPLISTYTTAMSAYPRLDPYRASRYEHGIDAKVVVMGNSGEPPLSRFFDNARSYNRRHRRRPPIKALARPACYNDTLKISSIQRTLLPQPVHFSSPRKLPCTASRFVSSFGTLLARSASVAWSVFVPVNRNLRSLGALTRSAPCGTPHFTGTHVLSRRKRRTPVVRYHQPSLLPRRSGMAQR